MEKEMKIAEEKKKKELQNQIEQAKKAKEELEKEVARMQLEKAEKEKQEKIQVEMERI